MYKHTRETRVTGGKNHENWGEWKLRTSKQQQEGMARLEPGTWSGCCRCWETRAVQENGTSLKNCHLWETKQEFQGRENLGETNVTESHSQSLMGEKQKDRCLLRWYMSSVTPQWGTPPHTKQDSLSLCAPLNHHVGRHCFLFIQPLTETLSWGLPELGQEEEESEILEGDSRYGESWHHPPTKWKTWPEHPT